MLFKNKQANPSDMLQQALRLHQQGQFDQAALCYAAILEAQANHFDAMHLLGVLRYQQGRQAEALDKIQTALKWKPTSAEALSDLGLVFGALRQPEEALASYDKALAIRPDYAEALNNRGNALRDLKRPEEALASYDKALAIKPNDADVLSNRGNALRDLNRPEEALASHDKALAIKPNDAEALTNRGIALRDLERPEEALASYDKALAIRPDHADALNNRGNALRDLKRPEEALASYDKALAIRPDYAEAFNNRGVAFQDLKRPEEALASYDKALAIRPDHADALISRGIALQDLKRPEEALASYDKAFAIRPDYAEALISRGNALQDLRRPEEALASYDKALAIKPDYAEALNNRGNALRDLGRPEEALASYDKALAIRPDHADVLSNRGNALRDLKRPEEALASYDKALAIRPDYADALFNRGLCALSMGDFSAGWRGYEYRWDRKNTEARKLRAPYPNWKGEDIRGKRILVYDEQGLGDIIQFSRFLTQLVALDAEVTFLLRSTMHRLLSVSAPSVRLVAAPPKGGAFDFQCALMSLPGAFGTSRENLPSSVPYLFAEEGVVARWRERLGDHGLKIGICWQGNPDIKVDIGRSFPLRCFQPLAAISGVRLISLQKAHGLDQLENLPSGMEVETLGEDFDGGPDAFVDTAAVMSCLDLIITSVAHLAGALRRPVWVALKHVPESRWMLDRSDSPWYSTMKLYRQTIRDDWDSVFDQLAADVANLKADTEAESATALLQIPGSMGELFDKITILEVKAARIKDSGKLQHVRHELELLRGLQAKYGPSNDEQAYLVAELKSVNEALWDIEDDIRDCERRQDFGEEFISLARSVYKTNDRRAAVKKEINILRRSIIVEEKSHGGSGSNGTGDRGKGNTGRPQPSPIFRRMPAGARKRKISMGHVRQLGRTNATTAEQLMLIVEREQLRDADWSVTFFRPNFRHVWEDKHSASDSEDSTNAARAYQGL